MDFQSIVLCMDGKFYYAHIIILKYQSGYFLEYFKGEYDDKRKVLYSLFLFLKLN
jgi:hypothetical protein